MLLLPGRDPSAVYLGAGLGLGCRVRVRVRGNFIRPVLASQHSTPSTAAVARLAWPLPTPMRIAATTLMRIAVASWVELQGCRIHCPFSASFLSILIQPFDDT